MRKFAVLLVMMALLLPPLGALAADYAISAYAMDVAIDKGGSARVSERLTYEFDGSYNGILSSIDIGDVEALEDLKLYVDGGTLLREVDEMQMEPFTYTAEVDGDLLNIRAYAPGDGGARLFEYEYTLRGLAQRYQDAARLNYRLIGISNAVTLGRATITVAFPAAPTHYYVHGAMDEADLTLEGNVLTAGPRDVGSGEYVEIDALFPADSLALAPMIDRPIIQEALDTEARLAQERREAEETKRRLKYGATGIIAAFFIGAALILRGKIARFGLKKAIAAREDDAALEGLDAAVAEQLVRNAAGESGFSATLLELVQKRALSMHSEAHPVLGVEQVKFTVENRGVDMSPQQKVLFDWLFTGRDYLWIEDLDAGRSASDAQAFDRNYRQWQQAVRMQAEEEGLYFGGRAKMGCGAAMLAVGGVLLSIAAFALGLVPIGIAGILLTILILIGFSRVRSLTDLGEAKCSAVRGYCERYGGKITDMPSDALKYVPILVALGYVEPLTEYLERRASDPYYGYGDALPVWWYAGWHHDMYRVNRSFHDVRKHNASVASQSSSSSGGFSGSSGGGGGGGGHGAW
jgi:uncharacterized membrane protein